MEFIFTNVEKPDDWPINEREQDLELILKAVEEFEKNPGYRTREILVTMFSDYDFNQTAAIGQHRVCEYEVALINKLYIWGTVHVFPSLKCYLYNLVGQTARMQKMFSYSIQSIGQDESVNIPIFETGLWLPLRLYYIAYLRYTVDKDKPFADKIIEAVENIRSVVMDVDITDENKEFSLDALSRNYSDMLNDISYFRGSKKEGIWKFNRDELRKLFALEAELCIQADKRPIERPLCDILMTQISNFIMKSRHNYNEDYICKYVSYNAAESSFNNHEIWMNKIENLNDEREGHVVKELFENRDWILVDWVGDLVFTPTRRYFVSSFAKSIDNPDMKSEYGDVVLGFKGDRIADLISPLYEGDFVKTTQDEDIPDKIKRICFSMVTSYDVLYDVKELREEMSYLISIIDLFSMTGEEKNKFLNHILQYWLLSAKDQKWVGERERRYVLFLYDDYDYKEMEIDDDFLKLKTSLFVLPDFILGLHSKKSLIKPMIDKKMECTAYRKYLYCHNCFNRDFDIVAGLGTASDCPICGSHDVEIVTPFEKATE